MSGVDGLFDEARKNARKNPFPDAALPVLRKFFERFDVEKPKPTKVQLIRWLEENHGWTGSDKSLDHNVREQLGRTSWSKP